MNSVSVAELDDVFDHGFRVTLTKRIVWIGEKKTLYGARRRVEGSLQRPNHIGGEGIAETFQAYKYGLHARFDADQPVEAVCS